MYEVIKIYYVMIVIISMIFCSDSFCSFHAGCVNNYRSRQIQIDHSILSRTDVNMREFEYFKQSLIMLSQDELNNLYNVVDVHLIKNNDDHYLLFQELCKSLDNFEKILEIKKNLLKISKSSSAKLNISEDVLYEININKKYIYDRSQRLKRLGKKYIFSIKKIINTSNLTKNKVEFYEFVFDFIGILFDFITNNTHKTHVKLHYSYIINRYQTYEHCMHMLVNNISLPKILYHTEQCLRVEIDISVAKMNEIIVELRYLVKNINKFYQNIDKYLTRIRKNLDLIQECMKDSDIQFKH
ncbi:putative SP-containing protein [Vairimorpha necatrix]|uniref:SP-containing protein n=1 Tax=Vairimorpha necatrix TaxID=6039 RepID=A0AAX4JA01_9MICR